MWDMSADVLGFLDSWSTLTPPLNQLKSDWPIRQPRSCMLRVGVGNRDLGEVAKGRRSFIVGSDFEIDAAIVLRSG
jgi:hypothetical protein